MGLSLTSSLRVLASRTKTSKRAGVLLVSFVKDGGHAGKAEPINLATVNANGRSNALQRGSVFCGSIFQVFTSSFIISLSCLCLSMAQCNAPPKVSHKVAGREQRLHVRRDYVHYHVTGSSLDRPLTTKHYPEQELRPPPPPPHQALWMQTSRQTFVR